MSKISNQLLHLFTLMLISTSVPGQEVKTINVDLGKIKKNNEDVVDLVIKNPLDVGIKLISHNEEAPLTFQIMSTYIPAGGYQFFRVKTNMFRIGPFERKIELHFDRSELDANVQIRGNMVKLPSNGLQNCPSFNDMPSKRQLVKRQKKINGEIQSRLIPLGPETMETETKSEGLLNENHKANNIIFLIDVSSSMKRKGKMDLLKNSLLTLLNSLREKDRLSIVIYDDQAQLLVDNEKFNDKDSIRNLINSLSAQGSTNAIEGIDLAINKGLSSYLQNGNNQLYLVSDGAFDLKAGPNGSIEQIEKAANEGLNVSVLAILSNKQSRRSLKKLSKKGKGKLIRIDNERDQDKIIKNIMKNSKF